ncbi:tRNA (guanine(10)-N2)-methyltransferase homolog isoform X1 [Xenopus laevis]|uniref:tRNA (Guanine(10)-N2)-methyltransferase homolog isoform X1 n=1 Tax=Xenopus laevis TaxID=8355 RepID=A0A8J1KLB0_XENLA|nr:tRNA (guanine(10)-N2)-methyltransferase homolog isoform X1 [Xenopus laevis]
MALPCKTGAAFKKYLLLLAQENCEFRLPEIKSLLSLYGGHFNNLQDEHGKSPFCILNLPSEEMARKLMKRTVCAKSVFELWGHGKTFMEFQQSVLSYPLENMMSYLQPNSTYKIIIHSFNKTLTQKEKLEKINTMEFIPFQGKVNLQNAENIFYLLEDYGSDPNKAPNEPFEIFFGRWIADGQRELINSYSVKKRHFIGNTSMDAGLSFIMANHARVKPNDVVFDPFVGTGGLLVSSAHFGAYVCGTEIDYNTVHGLAPYGIRESTRKTGTQKEIIKTELFPESHVPVQLNYHLSDIFSDLFAFASEFLVTGGRLVYWLPVYRPEYTEEVLPRHPCLKLISNCEQMLSSHTSRRLITMEKVKEFEEKYQYAHLGEGQNLPYKGHNSFREKYFSGLKKRTAREERARSEMANAENVKSKGKEDV